MPELKQKLKEYRAKLDMKQGDLAEKVGVSGVKLSYVLKKDNTIRL